MDKESSAWIRNRGWSRWLAAALIALCGAWVYWPALNRVFAGDQIAYFLELDGGTSLASGLRLIDYPAVRQHEKGDEVLYRPLTHLGLALENAAFGRDFRRWNLASLVLHLGVACLLFGVLWSIRRTPLALAGALWFVLLPSNFELVSWNHLGVYMLGYGLLLAALRAARELGEDGAGARWLWIHGITMTGAMLVHEIAVVAAIGSAAFVAWSRWKKPRTNWKSLAVAGGAPLLIYAVLYGFHVARCERFLWVDPHAAASSWAGLASLPPLLGQWAQRILLPGHSMLGVRAFWRSGWLPPSGDWAWGTWGAGVLWLGLLACLWRGLARRRLKEAWPFGALLALLILSYAAMNGLGRSNAMAIAYYAYFPALFGCVLLYSLFDFSRLGRRAQPLALACLLLLAALNGWHTRRISEQVREANRSAAQFHGWLEQAVRPWLGEPGFTFAVEGVPPELDIQGPVRVGYPDEGRTVTKTLLQCLYGRHYDRAAPAETFVFPGFGAFPP